MLKQNNPLFYLPNTQLFPVDMEIGTIFSDNALILDLVLAKEKVNKSSYNEALAVYDELIQKEDKQPFLYACRSLLKFKMGEEEGAYYDYQIAKRLDFNYHHLLEWLNNRGEMLESEELLDLMNQDKSDEQFLINRATLLVQHFEYERALEDFNKAYSIGHSPMVLVSRGAINLRMVRYDKALLDFDEALRLDNQILQAYLFRAKLYQAIQESDLALQDFNTAISLNANDSSLYEERAQFFESLHQYEAAIADYTEMISLNTDDFYGYVLRADIFVKLEQWESALSDYTKAIELNPYYSDLYQYRGSIRQKLGDEQGAQDDFEKFEELEDE